MTPDELRTAIEAASRALDEASGASGVVVDPAHLRVLVAAGALQFAAVAPPSKWWGPDDVPAADRVWSSVDIHAVRCRMSVELRQNGTGRVVARLVGCATGRDVGFYAQGHFEGEEHGAAIGRARFAAQLVRDLGIEELVDRRLAALVEADPELKGGAS